MLKSMKLPIPGLFAKKDTSNYYLSLLLRDEKAVAIVLQEIDGKLKMIGKSETAFVRQLEEVPFEELLKALDKTISKAEEPLPPDIETEKTVFGVKESWVEEKKIKKDYLSTLKKLCDALSLQPIGFMVTSEAISHLLTEEEGAPLSAILAEIGTKQATLTLFRAGRILEVHSLSIEDSIPKTVDKLLHHFTTDVLPSRIIVFDGRDAEKLAQEFIAHHWSKSIPFLHVPQISVLPAGFDGKAMVYGAAEQMNFGVLDTFGESKLITLDSSEGKTTKDDKKEIKRQEETAEKDKPTDQAGDNEIKDAEDKSGEDETKEGHEMVHADNFGFVTGQDIASITIASSPATEEKMSALKHSTEKALPSQNRSLDQEKNSDDTTSGGMLQGLSGFFSAMSLKKITGGLPSIHFGGKMLLLPVILLLIIGAVALYFFSIKATVTLNMQTKDIDETSEITLRTDSSNDLSQKILAAEEVETSLEGTVSTSATGKKDVGDKAKGTVTLYNNSESKRTIPAGTVITSGNDLDFVTDKEAVVASASGDIFSGTKPGTSQAAVTAKTIGTEYNLPSNTKFTVAGVSSLAGKNDSAFSGGSKKEVNVVAKKDVDSLTTNLPKELEAKAKESIADQASSGQTTLPVFTSVELTKKSFDYDVGEETKKLTLKGTVTFTTLSYTTSDLKQLAESSLKGQFSQDLAISDKGVSADLENVKTDEQGGATATLIMRAGLLPKLNKDSIIRDLTGKSFDDASAYLTEIPQVQSADITFSPNLPLLPKLLPRIGRNITVVLNSND